jgi:antitoxin component YwqK of YwqJK toxin-antitoxin module
MMGSLFLKILLFQLLQSNHLVNDTIFFSHDELLLLSYSENVRIVDSIFLIGEKKLSSEEFNTIKTQLNSKTDLTGDEGNPAYCILLDENNNISEEGIWNLECFWGNYKKYHKNGKVAIEGVYANPYEIVGCVKINTWKYYNANGELIKSEYYDANGILNVIDD